MRIAILVFSFLFSLAACAQSNSVELYQEGQHYTLLPEAVKTITPGKIEVTEAFAYTCGHCYNFEPLILAWEKKAPEDVQLVKLPVIWRAEMQLLARIMYTGEALDMAHEVNARVFSAIHVEKKNLATEADAAKIFKDLGVDGEKFKKTFNSFGVSSRVQQADARTRSMKITGTPQIIVDGRYVVKSTKDMGHDGMLKVTDYLIEKIRAENAKK